MEVNSLKLPRNCSVAQNGIQPLMNQDSLSQKSEVHKKQETKEKRRTDEGKTGEIGTKEGEAFVGRKLNGKRKKILERRMQVENGGMKMCEIIIDLMINKRK
jgi:hypothetical protein